jgi:hypothetical protein
VDKLYTCTYIVFVMFFSSLNICTTYSGAYVALFWVVGKGSIVATGKQLFNGEECAFINGLPPRLVDDKRNVQKCKNG